MLWRSGWLYLPPTPVLCLWIEVLFMLTVKMNLYKTFVLIFHCVPTHTHTHIHTFCIIPYNESIKAIVPLLLSALNTVFAYSDSLIACVSALYGKLLVVMGMAFPVAEVISHNIPISFYNVSMMYVRSNDTGLCRPGLSGTIHTRGKSLTDSAQWTKICCLLTVLHSVTN